MSVREVSGYSQTQAVVRARYSTLLDANDWTALVECRDLDTLISLLSKTAYAPYLQIASEQLTARRLEYQIRWRLARDFEKLMKLTPEPGRQVIVSLWRSYEVDNLKAALRGVETGASWDQVRHLLSPMAADITLSMGLLEGMVRSGSVALAIERVAQTPYYPTLVHALERYYTEHNLFPLEVALDLEHRRDLWRSVQVLSGRDHDEALRLVGTILDNDNLMWALRYRVYHRLSEQEIVNYTLPFGYKVRDEDIRAIAVGEDVQQVILHLYPQLGDLGPLPDLGTGGLRLLEHFQQTRLAELCRATFARSPFHVGLPIAYLLLCEIEIRNLTTAIEGKASGLAPEVFEALLVL